MAMTEYLAFPAESQFAVAYGGVKTPSGTDEFAACTHPLRFTLCAH